MSNVIKAHAVRRADTGQPFAGPAGLPVLRADARATARWWLDVAPLRHVARERARQQLEEARQKAEAMVASARAEADTIRAQAREEGYQAGVAAGHEDGQQEARGQLEPLLTALRTVVDKASRAASEAARRDEEHIVRLALAIAARLSRQPEVCGPDAVRRVLQDELPRAAGTQTVTIRLHPFDLEALQAVTGELAGQVDSGVQVVWVADDRIARGGCLVETDRGQLDARVETRLGRIAEELMEVVRVGP